MHQIFTMLCVLANCYAWAQSQTVSGVVNDAVTRDPISSCNVMLITDGSGTSSNANGRFSIGIPNGITHARLLLSFVGYASDTVDILPAKSDYLLYLKPSWKSLGEVVVTGVSRATAIKENPFLSLPYPLHP
jgi:hypothetical protein